MARTGDPVHAARMSDAPVFEIDPAAFHADPFPMLREMREAGPTAFVPQLGATLILRHADIAREEKRIDVFASRQPGGLVTRLMGENLMRKDGEAHASERKAIFPAFSPRAVRGRWEARFRRAAEEALDELIPRGGCDLAADYAMRVSGEALRAITGLEGLTWQEMDAVSQAMIDGIANYAGDPEVESRCHEATTRIDAEIDAGVDDPPEGSLLAVQLAAGLPMESVRANIKLTIGGGQNEPRDAIAGAAWALLTHPEQLDHVREGRADWHAVFAEYTRWIAPICMAPREVARDEEAMGTRFEKGERVFLMFASGNRDEAAFEDADRFEVTRDAGKSLSFGAGPHFCAGAAAARTLVADVTLPMLFERAPEMRLAGEAPFAGWAFRGPLKVPIEW